MIDLGILSVYDVESKTNARKKIRVMLLKLGFSEIFSIRMEVAISEILRILLDEGGTCHIYIRLEEYDEWAELSFFIDPVKNNMNLIGLQRVFDDVAIRLSEKGSYYLRAMITIKNQFILNQTDFMRIEDIVRTLSLPSIEELMKEITKKNEELALNQQFLQSILQNIRATIYVKDIQGKYLYVNNEFERLMAMDTNLIIGKDDSELFQNNNNPRSSRYDAQIINTKYGVSFEDSFIDSFGVERNFLFTKVPMMKGEVVSGICCIGTDITHLKAMEKELLEAKIIAEDAAKSKSDFLANMSHEIRTPMNAIIGMTYLIQKTELSEKQKDYIDKIQLSSQHLLGVINDILDFSKIEAGKLEIEHVDFRMSGVLENLSNLISEKCSSKGLELIFDVDSEIPDKLCGDPLRIGQILVNYTNNAVKFTSDGEIIVRIKKEQLTDSVCNVRFEVQDTGIGLTEEQVGKLFQSFQQADSTTSRKYGGTGLGLAISKRLTELMGGTVGVQSIYGKGSTFWFEIPIEIKESMMMDYAYSLPFQNRRVLVVDDNDHARIILHDTLQTMNLRVDMAENGVNAIRMVKNADEENEPYELIFMDMQMPGLTGTETYIKIKSLNLSLLPKCIMVTAYGREEVFLQARNAEIDLLLVKPVNPSMIHDSMMRLLGGSKIIEKINANEEMDLYDLLKPIRGAAILLAEDNELNQQIVIEMLMDGQFDLDVVSNGAQAVQKISEKTYDIVLMDMQMPILDGLEATKQIREKIDFGKLPIVALTANAMHADMNRCFEAGMNDHLAKPIAPERLFSVLLHWIPNKMRNDLEEANQEFMITSQSHNDKTSMKNSVDFHKEFDHFKIPGLDFESGLNRMMGKRQSYDNLLRKFTHGYEDYGLRIKKAMNHESDESAELLVHTLKGVAGNIGAIDIQKKAEEIEKSIRANRESDFVLEQVEALQAMLREIIQNIRLVLQENGSKTEVGQIRPIQDSSVLFDALKNEIESRKPKRCAAVLDECRKVAWTDDLKIEMENLERTIKKYKYNEALVLLDSLNKKVKEGLW